MANRTALIDPDVGDLPLPPNHPTDNSPRNRQLDLVSERYSDTSTVTQSLERDIIDFLSAKHTAKATLTVEEIMKLYRCDRSRASRVISALLEDDILAPTGDGTYKVIV